MKPFASTMLGCLVIILAAQPTMAHAGHDHTAKEKPEHSDREASPSPSPIASPIVLKSEKMGLSRIVVTIGPAALPARTHVAIRLEPADASGAKPSLAIMDPLKAVSWPILVLENDGYGADFDSPSPGGYELRFYPTGASDETPYKVIYVRP